MKGYEFSPDARDDLQEIWSYVAEDNVAAADKLEEEFYAACQLLASNPRLGHKRADLTDRDVRFWAVHTRYLIVYLDEAEPIKIVRILHGARNVTEEL
jgi:plasmid stabilization system protein ParE